MKPAMRTLLLAGLCTAALAGPQAMATVISTDGNGQYSVDEAKDFRQRAKTDAANDAPIEAAVNPSDPAAPVMARIVTPQTVIAAETAKPQAPDEAAPVVPAELSVALPVEVEIFEPISAEIFDPTVPGASVKMDGTAQTQAAAKLRVSGPVDPAAMLASFVRDYSEGAYDAPLVSDDMTPDELVFAAANARAASGDAPKQNLAASVIPEAYKDLIGETDSNSPVKVTAVTPATQTAAPALSSRTDTKPYAALVSAAAENYPELDTALIHAVIEVESNYNPSALSKKSAMGLMQLMPKTAKAHKVVDAFDPVENIRAGTAELNQLMDKYDNVGLALAAYNAGQKAVDKYDGIPPYKETREYVVKVLSKTFDNRKRATKLPQVSDTDSLKVNASESQKKPRELTVYTYDW